MFTRYGSFVILAETLQWDEAAIDFAPDAADRAANMHRNRLRAVGRKFF